MGCDTRSRVAAYLTPKSEKAVRKLSQRFRGMQRVDILALVQVFERPSIYESVDRVRPPAL
jgi:hypothetical protein